MGKELINIKRQSGKKPNIPADQAIMALFPGKRMSDTGKIYWETRRNRSDLDKSKRL
jgi:hypothetical protein